MALAGMHIVFGYAGSNTDRQSGALLFTPYSSENKVTAGSTTITAPPSSQALGQPMVQCYPVADSFAAAGAAPNAANDTLPRVFCPAGQRTEFFVQPGDKISWAAA